MKRQGVVNLKLIFLLCLFVPAIYLLTQMSNSDTELPDLDPTEDAEVSDLKRISRVDEGSLEGPTMVDSSRNRVPNLEGQSNQKATDTWKVHATIYFEDVPVESKKIVRIHEIPNPSKLMEKNSGLTLKRHMTLVEHEGKIEFNLAAREKDVDKETSLIFELLDSQGHVLGRKSKYWPGKSSWPLANFGDIRLSGDFIGHLVTARILKGDGSIAKNLTIRVYERIDSAPRAFSRQTSGTTDEQGMLSIELATKESDDSHSISLDFDLKGSGASVPLLNRQSRILNIGDVHLKSRRLLVSGIVVDTGNNPVAGANVGIFVEKAESWKLASSKLFRVKKDGSFAVEADFDVTSFRVGAIRDGYDYTLSDVCSVGDSGIKIVIPMGGWIAGKLLVDQGVSFYSMKIAINTPKFRTIMRPNSNGEFVNSSPIPEGTYIVSCEVLGLPPMMYEDVRVTGGMTTKDSRLNPLDLSGKFKLVRLKCVDDERISIRSTIRVFDANGKSIGRAEADNNGIATIAIPMEEKQLRVNASMYVLTQIKDTRDIQEVILERFVAAVATIVGHTSTVGGQIKMVLRRDDGLEYPGTVRRGACAIMVPSGLYSIQLRRGKHQIPFSGQDSIVIKPGAGKVEFVLTVDPKVIGNG